jgi:hypothetical protein
VRHSVPQINVPHSVPAPRPEAVRGGPVAYVADGEENKNAAGLGIKKCRVLRRRGTGPVLVLFFDDAESGRRLRSRTEDAAAA